MFCFCFDQSNVKQNKIKLEQKKNKIDKAKKSFFINKGNSFPRKESELFFLPLHNMLSLRAFQYADQVEKEMKDLNIEKEQLGKASAFKKSFAV